jgi:uncharacterized flavoprotein (TIGR03862 family)
VIAIIGAGPAGLFAAEQLGAAGLAVTVYDRMPSVGRKLLMAGRGGLNLTHSENLDAFVGRYGAASPFLRPVLEAFPPAALMGWAGSLRQPTFVGSSGRVFPQARKASPLLRALMSRLGQHGVSVRTHHQWLGWNERNDLVFDHRGLAVTATADVTVLALGGASWARLGSDGRWAGLLRQRGIAVTLFRPANCGFTVNWSAHFRDGFHGQPLKGIALHLGEQAVRGEALVTRTGLEGGAVYALAAALRDAIECDGRVECTVDLRPDIPTDELAAALGRPRRGDSSADFLRKSIALPPVAINLLREAHGKILATEPAVLARQVKRVPLTFTGTSPLDRAISTAGGIALTELDEDLMLRALPDVYAAGEMLDWEAPTGGYLLQATLATAATVAKAILRKRGLARQT